MIASSKTRPPEATLQPASRIPLVLRQIPIWNGDIIADRPTLEAKFTTAAAQPVQPEFHLRPNKLVTYKHVAGVMATAQRNGITKIGLIGAEQFLD